MGLCGKKRILCFGDSNTWGYTPGTGERYPADIRWPGALQNLLGDDYCVIESGLNGRTSVFADPFYCYRNGMEALGIALLENAPLDMVIIALGTNDLQFTDARGAARGGRSLIYKVRCVCGEIAQGRFWPVNGGQSGIKAPEILLMSPIAVHKKVREMDPWSTLRNGSEESLTFARWFGEVAEKEGVYFLDSAAYAVPSDTDGIHMMPDCHLALAKAVEKKIRGIV